MVHLVVALHRIAKSTDFQQLRHSAPLREQLAQLANNAAEAAPWQHLGGFDSHALLECDFEARD